MKTNGGSIFFHIAVIFGLVMLVTPILLLANSVEPVIFGMPFLLTWVLCWWFFCTIILLFAYLNNWGKKK